MQLNEIVKFGISQNITNGKEIDLLITALGVNVLNNQPFINIELTNIDELLILLNSANESCIYLEKNESFFTAIYNDITKFPISRCYFIRSLFMESGKVFNVLEKSNYRLLPVPPIKFGLLIKENNFQERINTYKNNLNNEPTAMAFKNLFDGRKNNTIVSGALFLKSQGCFNCGDTNISNFLNTTIEMGDKGLLIGIFTCDKCYEKAFKSNSIIEFIFNKFGLESPIKYQNLSKKDLLAYTKDFIENTLNCKVQEDIKIKKVKEEIQYTITAIRNSGFKIIFRLLNLLDYGYMIFNPHNKQIYRIDTADHHNNKLAFAPDHIHYKLPNNNKVKSSYTYGSILFDYKIILNLLETEESKFISS